MNDDPRTTQYSPFRSIFIIAVLFLFGCPSVSAEPLFQAQAPDGVVITLHSEKCALKEVTNLPARITWEEKGKVTEGRFGAKAGMVIFYFADKTVGVIPVQVFEKVIGV